jgi:hypothetical protein
VRAARGRGRVLGVLALSSVRPRAFADDDVVFLLTPRRQQRRRWSAGACSPRSATRAVGCTFLAMASARSPPRSTSTRRSTPSRRSPCRPRGTGARSTCSTSTARRSS